MNVIAQSFPVMKLSPLCTRWHIVTYNKQYMYFDICPSFWQEALKALLIAQVLRLLGEVFILIFSC